MSLRRVFGELFALFCAVMLGLAAGAVWLLPTLYLHRPMPLLILVIGALLAWAIRQWVHIGKWNAAVLAAIATVVAAVYVHVLDVAVTLWAMTSGYGLIGVMRRAGMPMLLDIARMGVSTHDVFWCACGAVFAALVALRSARNASRPAS